MIINKPKSLIVHPGAGNPNGTLLNSLIYHYPKIIQVPRAGIVHRLDKNTTGLMVIAKNKKTHEFLTKLIKEHKIIREYEAIVFGIIKKKGIINKPITRNIKIRTKMMIHKKGKKAITHFSIIENFKFYTRLKLKLETGRTHQIRVHLSSINHPIVGDAVYNKKIYNTLIKKINKNIPFNRQALHARKLSFQYPYTNKIVKWKIDLPKDMKKLICYLKD